MATELDLTGPILAERGAVIHWPDEEITLTGSASPELFSSIRSHVIRHFSKENDVICRDPTMILKTLRYRTKNLESLVLVNSKQEYSFHASTHFLTDTAFLPNPELLKKIEQFLRIYTNPMDVSFDWDVNPEYNLVILHDARTTKTFGTRALMQHKKTKGESIALVGDGANDFTRIPGIKHWAVGNATNVFKQQCTRIANQSYTQGVCELLLSLS